ncbi:hypothetical protein Bbelb_395620 [Branchiostoma belcheri]|nr:hypothetical protein Bbelb_395620 [Branchiostoma belcheri]
MYQVPPVKGISLYKERDRDISDLWNPNFEVVELEEIMRQKDDAAFAKLLNRMRVKRKKDKLSDEDDEVLSSRVLSVDFEADDYPKDALHIFSTNIAVAEHNDKMLRLRCPDVRCFEASDFVKDPTTGSMKRRDLARGGKDDLPDVVKVGVGARVMLSRNVNVADGLVNGAFGTVSGVAGGQDDAREVATVFVQFDNPKVQLESFNMFRKDRSGRRVCEDGSSATSNAPHGGVAVYVRDVYRCSEIPIPDDIGLECVEEGKRAPPRDWGGGWKTTSLSSDWDEGGKPQACPVIGTRVENHKLVRREVRAPPVIGEEGGQSSPVIGEEGGKPQSSPRDWGGGRREVRAPPRDWGGGRSELPPVIGEEAGNPVIGEEGGQGQAVTWLEDPAQSIQQGRKQNLVQEKQTGEEPAISRRIQHISEECRFQGHKIGGIGQDSNLGPLGSESNTAVIELPHTKLIETGEG